MVADRDTTIAILYSHPLLGEGIARSIAAQTGVTPLVAPATQHNAVMDVVAKAPAILVFERTAVLDAMDLGGLLPETMLVDVTHAVAAGAEAPECLTGLDLLSRLVRDAKPSVSGVHPGCT